MNHTGVRSTGSRRAARTSSGSTRPRLAVLARGPLAVRWLDWTLGEMQAGATGSVRVELENTGSVRWRKGIRMGYHWLDERGNPLVWDGERTEIPHLEPGERGSVDARVRAPIPPGRYRLSLDLVAEFRAWFSELGGTALEADVEVEPRGGNARAEFPDRVVPARGAQERIGATHAEGYAVVAGAIQWEGGLRHPRPRTLDPYKPGAGRIPGFPHPLLCPSVLEGVELT